MMMMMMMMTMMMMQARLYTPGHRTSIQTLSRQQLQQPVLKEQTRPRAIQDHITRLSLHHIRPRRSAPPAASDRLRSATKDRRCITRCRSPDLSRPRHSPPRLPLSATSRTPVRLTTIRRRRRRLLDVPVVRQLRCLSTDVRREVEWTCPGKWRREQKRLNNSVHCCSERR